jgi:hypothetical protein
LPQALLLAVALLAALLLLPDFLRAVAEALESLLELTGPSAVPVVAALLVTVLLDLRHGQLG